MLVRFGNLSAEEFAKRVGTEFTESELNYLNSVWSQKAKLTSAEDFHISELPGISITIGSPDSKTLKIFVDAYDRKVFNRNVGCFLDEEWKKEYGVE